MIQINIYFHGKIIKRFSEERIFELQFLWRPPDAAVIKLYWCEWENLKLLSTNTNAVFTQRVKLSADSLSRDFQNKCLMN